jgi:hypothetical protein
MGALGAVCELVRIRFSLPILPANPSIQSRPINPALRLFERLVGRSIMHGGRSHDVGPSGSNIGGRDRTHHRAARRLHNVYIRGACCHLYALSSS